MGNPVRAIIDIETVGGETVVTIRSLSDEVGGAEKMLAKRALHGLVSSERFPRIESASETRERIRKEDALARARAKRRADGRP